MSLKRGANKDRGPAVLALALAGLFLVSARGPGRQEAPPEGPPGTEFVVRVNVRGNIPWTDTGLEIKEGEEYYIKAAGNVSLQKGNPMAFCGPEGLDFKTVQQPVQDKNIGALVARVAHLVSITTDEETGEQTRNEIVKFVFIGPESMIRMPLTGRLYLGLNENVVGDNDGEFAAEIFRKTD